MEIIKLANMTAQRDFFFFTFSPFQSTFSTNIETTETFFMPILNNLKSHKDLFEIRLTDSTTVKENNPFSNYAHY